MKTPKTLFIVRGLPGSGKSTLAKKLTQYNCAADDWMVDNNGNYQFEIDKLGYCHKQCLEQVEKWMGNNGKLCSCPTIAVHNTFTTNKEIKPYLQLAKKNGYKISVIHCENNFGNIHNVPEETISKMKERWQDFILKK